MASRLSRGVWDPMASQSVVSPPNASRPCDEQTGAMMVGQSEANIPVTIDLTLTYIIPCITLFRISREVGLSWHLRSNLSLRRLKIIMVGPIVQLY